MSYQLPTWLPTVCRSDVLFLQVAGYLMEGLPVQLPEQVPVPPQQVTGPAAGPLLS